MATVEATQKKLAQEIENMTNIQKDIQKLLNSKVTLNGQLTENKIVKDELDFLEPGDPVFKLTGPVMIPYEIEEAKQNVTKRIEFINGELKRINDSISELLKKQEKQREMIGKLEKQFKSSSANAMAVA